MKWLSAFITIVFYLVFSLVLPILDWVPFFIFLLVGGFVGSSALIFFSKNQQQKDIGHGVLIGSIASLVCFILFFIWILTTQFK